MQNWDAMQPAANYDQHNTWYNSMFAANIKQEPGTSGNHSPLQSPIPGQSQGSATTQLEQYLKQQQQQQAQQQQQQQHQAMDTMSLAMTPSPSNNDSSMQHFFDTNIQQQFMQQQQYQQHFQQAQQAAAQNHQLTSTHLTLGFNPLTPPGLPNAVLPPPPPHNTMSHFYASMRPGQQQTPSPQPPTPTLAEHVEKLQAALTPRNTPPMDVTPPKSPKSQSGSALAASDAVSERAEKEHDLISNSSEDMKYIVDSEDDESIRMPIYNSHGKMKNYKCKTCGVVAITKVAFWDHARTHMKPDKILQCPKCPFVTEFKHHLEYHIRKHKNQKPFQCDKCTYTCVNKSMLNSHRKSHSSVYQYRCADCDYATKYCHSFKLHLRKYDHKPGMVLDEEGNPNPSLVIDVYGTRRGPKNKSGSGSGSSKRSSNAAANELKPSNSQLSAALQGFSMPAQAQLQQLQQQQQQAQPMPVSPAKSSASSTATELPSLKLNMSLQQPQLQQQQQQQQQQQLPQVPANAAANLLPPLASILQQNRNMAFFPYWNLNLQMLAAQQQAAVLAQLSPRMRESTLQQLQQQQHQQLQQEKEHAESMHDADADEEDEDDDDFERKSVDSAMDLSQGTPTKEEQQQTPAAAVAINLKLQDDDTPLNSTTSTSRRKGRVLKLDTLLQLKSASQSPEQLKTTLEPMPTASSPIAQPPSKLTDDGSSCSADESMETGPALPNTANTSASSTASSSGNSSNSSTSSNASSSLVASSASASVATVSANGSGSSPPAAVAPGGAIYECKYCDIYFKDAVLYTIHMGYHSCDDVFKCNMCGEKCDGPVGLFVHMARNAHS